MSEYRRTPFGILANKRPDYIVGDELFIPDEAIPPDRGQGPMRRGDEMTYDNYRVRLKEEDTYKGQYGRWAKIIAVYI